MQGSMGRLEEEHSEGPPRFQEENGPRHFFVQDGKCGLGKLTNILGTDLGSFPPILPQQSPSVNPNKSECQHLLTSGMCRQFLENKYLCEP